MSSDTRLRPVMRVNWLFPGRCVVEFEKMIPGLAVGTKFTDGIKTWTLVAFKQTIGITGVPEGPVLGMTDEPGESDSVGIDVVIID